METTAKRTHRALPGWREMSDFPRVNAIVVVDVLDRVEERYKVAGAGSIRKGLAPASLGCNLIGGMCSRPAFHNCRSPGVFFSGSYERPEFLNSDLLLLTLLIGRDAEWIHLCLQVKTLLHRKAPIGSHFSPK